MVIAIGVEGVAQAVFNGFDRCELVGLWYLIRWNNAILGRSGALFRMIICLQDITLGRLLRLIGVFLYQSFRGYRGRSKRGARRPGRRLRWNETRACLYEGFLCSCIYFRAFFSCFKVRFVWLIDRFSFLLFLFSVCSGTIATYSYETICSVGPFSVGAVIFLR